MEINELMDKFQNDLNRKKGGFKRIDTLEDDKIKPCRDKEHNPPSHIVLPEGRYEYTCPSCGHITIVNSHKLTL